MAQSVSDFLVQRLHEWGIKRIYGFPGDGINGILGALNRANGLIEFTQVRHEEMAAFMACAHAKFTGEVGICLATSGPGAIHLLNGLYDAKLDHQPVVAIVGQSSRLVMGGNFQQEVDLQTLFKDVASQYVQTAMAPGQVKHLIDRAIRIARATRDVTAVIIPNDLQEEEYKPEPQAHGTIHSGLGTTTPHVIPRNEDLQRAADILNAGEKVAMLIGAGTFGAMDEVMETADLLGAGVAKALLGKSALPDTLPYVTGSIGLLGTKPSWDMMQECDTLLMVGSSFPYCEFYPPEGKAKAVQIDIDAKMLSIRYPMDVNLVGDSRESLRALIPMLKRKANRSWREKIEKAVGEWWQLMERRAMTDANPINPQRVYYELSKRLPDNAILAADSGTTASWYAQQLKFRRGMMGSLSGNLATMGPGVPYVIAAKFAFPDRVAIGCIGDGAMQMNGMNELITIAKYWKEWSNPHLVIVVLTNRDLNMVTWEQRVLAGDPRFMASQAVPDVGLSRVARDLGLEGIRVEKPDDIGAGLDHALSCGKPCLIEFLSDPEVPPLPPHITFEQAKHFMEALVKDPERGGMIKDSVRQMIDAFKK